MARAAVQGLSGVVFLAALLAADHFATFHEQLGLGALTCAVLVFALTRFPVERRAQAIGVVCFATIGEYTGSILWGVYHYRLHNLPTFVPPAHGIVYLTGLSLAVALRRHARTLVAVAAAVAATWGVLGLTVLPRRDVAGAVGVPLLLLFLWRSRNRAIYASVFLVVTALELYGTALGTWRWALKLPVLGIPDGNPPSGVASGYVWFDVMALLLAPALLSLRALRKLDRSRPATQTGARAKPARPDVGSVKRRLRALRKLDRSRPATQTGARAKPARPDVGAVKRRLRPLRKLDRSRPATQTGARAKPARPDVGAVKRRLRALRRHSAGEQTLPRSTPA